MYAQTSMITVVEFYSGERGRPYMTSDARGREGVKQNLMISDEGGGGSS